MAQRPVKRAPYVMEGVQTIRWDDQDDVNARLRNPTGRAIASYLVRVRIAIARVVYAGK